MNKTCIYCEGALTKFKDYLICDKCKVVLFSKDISDDKKKSLINDYLTIVRADLLRKEELLHDIEQKYTLGETLTNDEKMIRNNLVQLNDIFTELDAAFKSNNTLNNKQIKGLLYRLLMISGWLSKNFGRNV